MGSVELIGILAFFIVVGAFAVMVWCTVLWVASVRRRSKAKVEAGTGFSRWIVALMVAVIGLMVYMSMSGNKARVRARPAPPGLSAGTIAAIFGSVFVVMFGYFLIKARLANRKSRDRDDELAIKRAQSGDVDGAISDLRAVIEERGSSGPLAVALGRLHMRKEQWAEALDRFVEVEKAGGREAFYLILRGAALRKLGRPEEALQVIREAMEIIPLPDPDVLLGLILVDLGRLDEARVHLARAERTPRLVASSKRIGGGPLEELRRAIAVHPESRARALFDEG